MSWLLKAMGGKPSVPAPEPLSEEPWRKIQWSGKQAALQDINSYEPFKDDQYVRILLHGAVGAGKSSFINSVQSALRGRMCDEALTENTSGDSFTKEYQTYQTLKMKPGSFYPFVFNDIMGLSADRGVQVDDVKLALRGHVKNGYKFNPVSALAPGDQFYNQAPTDNDKVHVLVCVVAADTLPTMADGVKKQIRDIRTEARRLDIPQVVVLTKVDLACPEVKKDLRNVYRSERLKEMMEQFSKDVGIPVKFIFPVKNYHDEISLNDDVDCLLLSVLEKIINSGDDFLNRKLQSV